MTDTSITWTDEAVDAALAQWLPGKHEQHQAPALRGAMLAALTAASLGPDWHADGALTAWDETAEQHRRDDPAREDWEDLAPYFDAEPARRPTARRKAMDAAIAAAREAQAREG